MGSLIALMALALGFPSVWCLWVWEDWAQVRLGAALPVLGRSGGSLEPDSLADAAAAMERLGYSSLWAFDAVGRGFMLPDPLMALAVSAGATRTVELGTGIMQLPVRNVAEVAHRLFTLELVAPDRVRFGVGPGSTQADFEVLGREFDTRFTQFEQQWQELRMFVREGRAQGRDLCAWPQVINRPELLLAGWRGPWIERAAAEAAGWIASAAYTDDEELAGGLARFREAGGRRAIVANVRIGADIGPTVERLHRLAAMGFDDAVVFDKTASEARLAAVQDAMRP